MKNIFIICLMLLLPFMTNAQEANKSNWTKVSGPKGEFSVLLPSNFLVDNDGDDANRAYAYEDEVTIRIEILEGSGGKSRVKTMRQFRQKSDWTISGFKLGEFIGDVYTSEKDKYFSMSIYAASPRGFYTVWVSTKNKKSAALETFLRSIKLDNQPLLKQQTPPVEDTGEAVLLSSLKTSESVRAALKKADAVKVKVKYELEKNKEKEEEKEDEKEENADATEYSRPLFILRRPPARYTMNGRQNGVQGTVKLKVSFLADGKIGEIIVLKKLDEGLTDAALDAARRIKFLPAEIDGKAVDVSRTVAYTFTIY